MSKFLTPQDIEQIEVIKGSNTVLFGSEGFSGIINVVPKVNKKYNARFSQKIGSYNSGEWNLMLNENFFQRMYLSYNIKQSGSKRGYSTKDGVLQNRGSHHSRKHYTNGSKSTYQTTKRTRNSAFGSNAI